MITALSTRPFLGNNLSKMNERSHFSAPVAHFMRLAPTQDSVRFSGPQFSYVPYDGIYNAIYVATDFNDGTSNAEMIQNLRKVLQFVKTNRKLINRNIDTMEWAGEDKEAGFFGKAVNFVLNLGRHVHTFFRRMAHLLRYGSFQQINSVADVPPGNIDYASFSLLRVARQANKDIFIHVADPGVGNGDEVILTAQQHDRSILITEDHGIHIGPNNGSLGLLIKSIDEANKQKTKKEKYELLPIDLGQVQRLEQLRLHQIDKNYVIPETYHARDVFAVVAGSVAGGIDPHYFEDVSRRGKVKIVFNDFANSIQTMPLEKQARPVTFRAFRDNTFGNIKTNLTLSHAQMDALYRQNAVFEIQSADGKGKPIEVPFKKYFGQVPKNRFLVYLGSSYSPIPRTRFVELAINLGDASQALGISPLEGKALKIRRIR